MMIKKYYLDSPLKKRNNYVFGLILSPYIGPHLCRYSFFTNRSSFGYGIGGRILYNYTAEKHSKNMIGFYFNPFLSLILTSPEGGGAGLYLDTGPVFNINNYKKSYFTLRLGLLVGTSL